MARWEAGAEARLTRAAYELYVERGFDEVTVAEIAARAGLTKRTFFRYFADKREVLFSGAADFQQAVVSALVGAPDGSAPIDAVVAALALGGSAITDLGDGARLRQRLVESSADLQEREMIKMVSLTAAITGALRQRGVGEPTAGLAAQAGVAVFRTAFERWAGGQGPDGFPELMVETLAALRTAVGGAGSEPPPAGRLSSASS